MNDSHATDTLGIGHLDGAATARPTGLPSAISIKGLHMSYGGRDVVAGIDLEVATGEVFAFLGPNGAGKTTTVEILEGFRRRSSGHVEVLGQDPQHGGS